MNGFSLEHVKKESVVADCVNEFCKTEDTSEFIDCGFMEQSLKLEFVDSNIDVPAPSSTVKLKAESVKTEDNPGKLSSYGHGTSCFAMRNEENLSAQSKRPEGNNGKAGPSFYHTLRSSDCITRSQFRRFCYTLASENDSQAKCKFICFICKTLFARKDYLSIHMLTHTKFQQFFCETCNLSSTDKSNHSTHECTPDRYRCKACNRAFSDKIFLLRHRCPMKQLIQKNVRMM